MIPILRKCLEELSKDGPNIDYVRGMIETLIEMNGPLLNPIMLSGPGKVTTLTPGVFHTAEAGIPARNVPEFVKDSVTTT